LQERLAQGVGLLEKWLAEQGVPATFWDHLPALAAGIPRNDELANVVLTKTIGRDRAAGVATWLAALLRELELPWQQHFPELTEQLALRGQPLSEQWDARGPGMLRLLSKMVEPELLVEQADVVLVQPVLGGGGRAQTSYNSVRIEAVLANPTEQLPEVTRLAWMLSQLNLDLPRYRDLLQSPAAAEAERLGALAMIPPTLAVAVDVELARCDTETMTLACEQWAAVHDPAVVQSLHIWWDTYLATRPPFAVALRALEDMLRPVAVE
jgi:hypothetical protein